MASTLPRPDNGQKPRYYTSKRDRERGYDEKLDGWNVHKIRRTPTVDELIARKQGF
jgi:hypothetical protein